MNENYNADELKELDELDFGGETETARNRPARRQHEPLLGRGPNGPLAGLSEAHPRHGLHGRPLLPQSA